MQSNIDIAQLLSELVEAEKARTCGQGSAHKYLEMHRARFADILRLCRAEVPDSSARVLDIGRSELTACLAKYYPQTHSLGLDLSLDDGGHREVEVMEDVPHIVFDLLRADKVESWPASGQFDLIVFSEVLEHLCVAPEFVLAALGYLLAANGVLICTTPNAADIGKRIRSLIGQNPYELLRLYTMNPGHVREYTKSELCTIANKVQLRCSHHAYFNWIHDADGNPVKASLIKLLRVIPSFRPFQACVLRRT